MSGYPASLNDNPGYSLTTLVIIRPSLEYTNDRLLVILTFVIIIAVVLKERVLRLTTQNPPPCACMGNRTQTGASVKGSGARAKKSMGLGFRLPCNIFFGGHVM